MKKININIIAAILTIVTSLILIKEYFYSQSPHFILKTGNYTFASCNKEVPNENNTYWHKVDSINISNISKDRIDPALWTYFGILIEVVNDGNKKSIDPELKISYTKQNLFYHATLVEESFNYSTPTNYKRFYDGSNPSREYKDIESLHSSIDSPYEATVSLPDIDKGGISRVGVYITVDLNHDCKKSIPIKFQVIDSAYNEKSDTQQIFFRLIPEEWVVKT